MRNSWIHVLTALFPQAPRLCLESLSMYIFCVCPHGCSQGKQSAPVNVRIISRGQNELTLRRLGVNHELIRPTEVIHSEGRPQSHSTVTEELQLLTNSSFFLSTQATAQPSAPNSTNRNGRSMILELHLSLLLLIMQKHTHTQKSLLSEYSGVHSITRLKQGCVSHRGPASKTWHSFLAFQQLLNPEQDSVTNSFLNRVMWAFEPTNMWLILASQYQHSNNFVHLNSKAHTGFTKFTKLLAQK